MELPTIVPLQKIRHAIENHVPPQHQDECIASTQLFVDTIDNEPSFRCADWLVQTACLFPFPTMRELLAFLNALVGGALIVPALAVSFFPLFFSPSPY